MELPAILNRRLLLEPLNWLIVGTIATIWLLAFHVIMQAVGAMQGGSDDKSQAPGQSVAGPPPSGGGYAGSFAE